MLVHETKKDKTNGTFTEPPGAPDYHRFRLIDRYTTASSNEMRYTTASSNEMKKKVLTLFMIPDGKLRIVVATTVFSMGIDCPDIRNVFHYGPPASIDQYVQETGRAGRDGNHSSALLFRKANKNMQQTMVDYSKNTKECRRKALFKRFMFYDEVTSTKCVLSHL